MALCLCDSYQQQPDTALGNRIIQIYRRYGNHHGADSTRLYTSVDSVIKNKAGYWIRLFLHIEPDSPVIAKRYFSYQ